MSDGAASRLHFADRCQDADLVVELIRLIEAHSNTVTIRTTQS